MKADSAAVEEMVDVRPPPRVVEGVLEAGMELEGDAGIGPVVAVPAEIQAERL